jgi:hypothetical protein
LKLGDSIWDLESTNSTPPELLRKLPLLGNRVFTFLDNQKAGQSVRTR